MSERRNYMCTINIDDQESDPNRAIPDWSLCKWLKQVTFQLERGEKTKKLHWQVFIELKNPRRFTDLQKIIPCLRTDLRAANNMHPNAGRAYVHKNETRVGGRFFWTQTGYSSECQHTRGVVCTSDGQPPAVKPIYEIIPKRELTATMTDSNKLKTLLENKMDEMRMYQAFIEGMEIRHKSKKCK